MPIKTADLKLNYPLNTPQWIKDRTFIFRAFSSNDHSSLAIRETVLVYLYDVTIRPIFARIILEAATLCRIEIEVTGAV